MGSNPPAQPLILRNAKVTIDGQTLDCLCHHAGFNRNEEGGSTLTTFCGSQKIPGIENWELDVQFYQTWDAGGTDEILSAAAAKSQAGTPVTYELVPTQGAVTDTNPSYSGECFITYNPWPGTDAGNPIDLQETWSCTGAPTKGTGATEGRTVESGHEGEAARAAA